MPQQFTPMFSSEFYSFSSYIYVFGFLKSNLGIYIFLDNCSESNKQNKQQNPPKKQAIYKKDLFLDK